MSNTEILAYNVKTKTKNCPMKNAVINCKDGRYVAVGDDGDGNKMAVLLNSTNAKTFVENGAAKKGTGWAEEPKA